MSKNIIKNIPKKKVNKKKIIIVVAVGVLVVASAVGGWYAWSQRSTKESASSDQSAPESKDGVAVEWETANAETDFDKGEVLLREKVEKSTTDVQRASAYAQLSQLALNNERYDVALEYAKKADELAPTRQTAFAVAAAADSVGQRDVAIQYYRIAIERAEKDSESNGDPQGSLRRFIGEMNRYIEGTML